jgi:hypothetical protein
MLSAGSGVSIVDSGTGNLTISSSGLNTLSNEGGGARVYDDVSSTPTDALLRTLLGTSNGLTVTQGLTTITIDNTLTGSNVGVGTGMIFSAKSGATLQFNTLAGTSNGLTVSASSSNVITIDNTLTGSNLGSGSQIFSAKSGANLQFRSLIASGNLSLTQNTNDITLNSSVQSYGQMILNSTATLTVNPGPVEILGLPSPWSRNTTSTSDVTMSTEGRLTYVGATTKNFFVIASCSTSGNTDEYVVRMGISGSTTAPGLGSALNRYINGGGSASIVAVKLVLSTNDYISLFITRTTGASVSTIIRGANVSISAISFLNFLIIYPVDR